MLNTSLNVSVNVCGDGEAVGVGLGRGVGLGTGVGLGNVGVGVGDGLGVALGASGLAPLIVGPPPLSEHAVPHTQKAAMRQNQRMTHLDFSLEESVQCGSHRWVA